MFNKILELLINIKSGPDNKGIKTFKITNYDALGDILKLQKFPNANSQLQELKVVVH